MDGMGREFRALSGWPSLPLGLWTEDWHKNRVSRLYLKKAMFQDCSRNAGIGWSHQVWSCVTSGAPWKPRKNTPSSHTVASNSRRATVSLSAGCWWCLHRCSPVSTNQWCMDRMVGECLNAASSCARWKPLILLNFMDVCQYKTEAKVSGHNGMQEWHVKVLPITGLVSWHATEDVCW